MICCDLFFSSLTILKPKYFFLKQLYNQNIFYSHKNELLVFDRQELLKKAKDRYHNCGGKEKAVEYHIDNKVVLKENGRNKYRNMSVEEKEVKREYAKNRYKNMKENEKTD